MPIRCLIVDDEPLAVQLIKSYCLQVPGLEVVATCYSAIDASSLLWQQRFDLLFLDIQMPRLTGIDFIRNLADPPKIILVTGYGEYAIESYELDVVDYLLKPVSFPRFMKAVTKAARLLSGQEGNAPAQEQTGEGIRRAGPAEDTRNTREPLLEMFFKGEKEMIKVALREILFIDSAKENTRLHLEDGQLLLVRQSIGALEKLLLPHHFHRIHRSYIVPAERVQSYKANRIQIGGQLLPVGRLYKSCLQPYLPLFL